MGIEKRILHLLYFQDCVIIPGLGGFVSKYVPAKMKEESQSFFPPTKEIVFNRELIHDDGVLAGYIAQCDKTSKSDASKRVEKFVNHIYSELAEKGTFSLVHLGVMRYERTGELVFRLGTEENFLPASYGLSSFYVSKYEKENVSPLLRSAIFNNREKGRTISLPGTLDKAQRQRSMRRVAVALPLLIAISLLPFNNRNGARNQHNNAGFFPLPSLALVEMPDNESSIQDVSEGSLNYFDVDTGNSEAKNIHPPIDRNSFAIVAGSFSTEENAETLRQDLGGKGYGPEIWKASNGFFRVIVQAYDTMDSAQQAIVKLKKDLSDIEFWVLQ